MKLEDLKPGMTVFDVGTRKMGSTSLKTVAVWPVTIVSVDVEKRRVHARWNGNEVRVFFERSVVKWRQKPPLLVRTGLVTRLAQTQGAKQAGVERGSE